MKDNIQLAIASLKANKMRSLLTMLGIIIGISSVIAILTVGDAMTSSVNDTISSIGANSLTISITQKDEENSSGNLRLFTGSDLSDEDYISPSMVEEFTESFSEELSYVSLSESVNNLSTKANDTTFNLSTTGINYEYQNSQSYTILTGSKLSEADIENASNVMIIEEELATEMFGTIDPIGQKVEVYNGSAVEHFYIVGVSESSESLMGFSSNNPIYDVYIPITTAKNIANTQEGYSSISAAFKEDINLDDMQEYTQTYFESYYIYNPTYTAQVSDPSSMLESMTEMLVTIQLAIAAIAAISLLVGGIGVMNIMLVSITERTKEIGTRKALGAPRKDIMFQFVTEAVIICLIGGLIGASLGLGIGIGASTLLGFPSFPSLTATIFAILFSMGIGLFFGYYPASKAAKLDPIEALRYE